MYISSQQKGFTLIEALIAIFIFSLALVSLITITSRGITGVAQARDQAIAQFLAQEGIEMVRNIRDTNLLGVIAGNGASWDDGLSDCYNGGFGDFCSIIYTGNASDYYQVTAGGNSSLGLAVAETNDLDFYKATSAASGKFTREIYYTNAMNSEEVTVHSIVTWTNGAIPRRVHLVTTLTKWIPTQP